MIGLDTTTVVRTVSFLFKAMKYHGYNEDSIAVIGGIEQYRTCTIVRVSKEDEEDVIKRSRKKEDKKKKAAAAEGEEAIRSVS